MTTSTVSAGTRPTLRPRIRSPPRRSRWVIRARAVEGGAYASGTPDDPPSRSSLRETSCNPCHGSIARTGAHPAARHQSPMTQSSFHGGRPPRNKSGRARYDPVCYEGGAQAALRVAGVPASPGAVRRCADGATRGQHAAGPPTSGIAVTQLGAAVAFHVGRHVAVVGAQERVDNDPVPQRHPPSLANLGRRKSLAEVSGI